MKVRDITDVIEGFAPLALQESYDNSGLVVGRYDDEVSAALIAVDVTDEVIDEALEHGCNMIITHHPIIFHPLKRLNSANYVERCVERAIRHGIALYACHTNLDSAEGGMSWYLAKMLGVGSLSVLEPSVAGGTTGFGVVGDLPEPMDTMEFFERVRRVTGAKVLRHSEVVMPTVQRIALCTGSGASLMPAVARSGADLYLSSDMKYNDFMTPDGAYILVDTGHFESEYCVIEILFDILSKKLLTFAVRKSERSCNPINYFV